MLVVVLLVVCMPKTIEVAAESLQSEHAEEEEESVYEPDFSIDAKLEATKEDAYIEFEAEYKRTEYEKHFYMSNGTYMSETYAQPIHYLDEDGKYQDIDNTLVEYVENGVEKVKNAKNSFTAEFAKNVSSVSPLITVSKEQYKLNLYLDQEKKCQIGNKKAIAVDKTEQIQAEINSSDKFTAEEVQISYADKKLKESIKNEKLNSKLKYAQIQTDTDFEYTVEQKSVKESIIVNDRQDTYSYSFYVDVDNLYLELWDNGSIMAFNGVGDVIYVMPAPYMNDDNGAYSDNVRYELDFIDEYKYNITVVADENWINAEAAFPVSINPAIETSYNTDNFRVAQVNSEEKISGEWYIPQNIIGGNRLVVKYSDTPSTKAIHTRTLKLNMGSEIKGYTYDDTEFDSYLTWESTEELRGDTAYISKDGIINIPFYEDNAAFVFNISSDEANNIQMLAVSTTYTEETGIESKYNPITYDNGDYTIYVKPKSLSYTVEIPYFTIDQPLMPLTVTAYYNPGFSAYMANLLNSANYKSYTQYYGKDIKLNIEQYMIKQDATHYVYIDADGTEHIFEQVSKTSIEFFNNDLGYTYNFNSRLMTVKLGTTVKNVMEFDSDGRMSKLYNDYGYYSVADDLTINNCIVITGHLNNGQGQTIILGRNSSKKFIYAYINGTNFKKVNISYNGDNLYKVNDLDTSYTRVTCGYDISSKQMNVISNRYDSSYELTFSNKKVSTITENSHPVNSFTESLNYMNYTKVQYYEHEGSVEPGYSLYSYGSDGELISQAYEPAINLPYSVSMTYKDDSNSNTTVYSTISAEFKRTDGHLSFRGIGELVYQNSISIASKFRNPVYVCKLQGCSDNCKVRLFYTVNGTTTYSPYMTIAKTTDTYLLLPMKKSAKIAGVSHEDSDNCTIYFTCVGEMVSKNESTIYKHSLDSGAYVIGDIINTETTAQGTTRIISNVFTGWIKSKKYTEKTNETTTISYTYNTGDRNHLVDNIITKTISNSVSTTKTEKFTYYEDSYNLLKQKETTYDNPSKTETETYEYDNGNIVKYEVSDDDHTVHTYDYTYELSNYGNYLLKTATVDGTQTTEYEYDALDKLSKVKDENGIVTYTRQGNKFTGYTYGDPLSDDHISYKYYMENGNITDIDRNGTNVVSYTDKYDADSFYIYSTKYANNRNIDYYYDKYNGQLKSYKSEDTSYDFTYDCGNIDTVKYNGITKTYSTNAAETIYTEKISGNGDDYTKNVNYDLNDYYDSTEYIIGGSTRTYKVEFKSKIKGELDYVQDDIFKTSYYQTSDSNTTTKTQYLGTTKYSDKVYTYENGIIKKLVDSSTKLEYNVEEYDRDNIKTVTRNGAA
ncbi:MAG: hypothetical protein J1F36_00905, partial [Clostridiales bacterium]|nr:hypothetical protein [Clostridiales bacterium]